MSRAALLLAASVVALCASGNAAVGLSSASLLAKGNPFQLPKRAKLLYNQNSNDAHQSINSQNYTSGSFSTFNDQAADDFVIPKGQTWRITEVDVTGVFSNGKGPATSQNVIFYKDRNRMPGAPIKNGSFTLDGKGGPDFAIQLPDNGIKLRAGKYWVSVVANVDQLDAGNWAWAVSGLQHGDQATWQNPHGGFGICPTWGNIQNCIGFGPDLMFGLRGSSKTK